MIEFFPDLECIRYMLDYTGSFIGKVALGGAVYVL